MNRWSDGTHLTVADLITIGLEHEDFTQKEVDGVCASFHNAPLFHTWLDRKTANTRLRMMGEGKLLLDTRTERNQAGRKRKA